MSTTPTPNEMIDALLDLDSGLTPWEVEFVESLDAQREHREDWFPSDRQMEKLEQVYAKRVT